MPEPGRIPVPLRLCRGCRRFVRIENEACDFCGGDLAALEAAHEEKVTEMRAAAEALRKALAQPWCRARHFARRSSRSGSIESRLRSGQALQAFI